MVVIFEFEKVFARFATEGGRIACQELHRLTEGVQAPYLVFSLEICF